MEVKMDKMRIYTIMMSLTMLILATLPGKMLAETVTTNSSGLLVVGDNEVLEIGAEVEFQHTGTIIVTGNGQIRITGGSLYLNGHLSINDDAVVSVDGGTFHLDGQDTHIVLTQRASLAIVNGARLHYVQEYVHQHAINAHDESKVFLFQAEMDSDGSAETVELTDKATYTAIATNFKDWTTWYMWNESRLILNGVQNAGDIVFYDNPTIDVKNTVGIMPWMYFPEGAVGDLTLPDTRDCSITSVKIDNSIVSGIGWSLSIENSSCVAMGINPYPGSDVTIRNSYLWMAMIRLTGDKIHYVPGEFKNREYHADHTFTSIPDRNLRLVNSTVQWWKIDAHENAHVIANDIVFSEMMVTDDARMWITNSICEGQTIHLGAVDNAVVYFKGGEVWSYTSAWGNATMILEDSLFDYTKAQYLYQYTNIAHQQSRMYAINTDFVSPPEDPNGALPRAADAALVMFAKLPDLLPAPVSAWIPIKGEAWIDSGPLNKTRFKWYTLSVRPRGGLVWRQFAKGIFPARRERRLGWFVPSLLGLSRGTYEIKLTIEVSGDDPATPWPTNAYPAIKEIFIY
jgi:hypothetical protein